MTPFQCNVKNPSKRVIGKPVPPVRCDGNPPCPAQPKWGNTTKVCPKTLQPLYWKNLEGNNIDNPDHCAPTYNTYYGFPDGAQNQIFTDNLRAPLNTQGDTLHSYENSALASPSILVSPLYYTKLSPQSDGNLVLSEISSGKALWSTNTAGRGIAPFSLVLGSDGNLQLKDSKNVVTWSSNTANKGYPPYRLRLRDTPTNLTIVDSNSTPLWAALH